MMDEPDIVRETIMNGIQIFAVCGSAFLLAFYWAMA